MPAIISGVVFDDLNHDGTFNVGEPGIANAFVVLQNTTGSCTTTQTDASGNYSFPDISTAGTYTIYETVADNGATCPPTIFTQPTGFTGSTTKRKLTVTVTAANISGNVTLSNNNFGHDSLASFDCQAFAWQTAVPGTSTTANLFRIDLATGSTVNTGPVSVTPSNLTIGFNTTDGNLYGWNFSSLQLFRLTPDRLVTFLPPVPNLPLQSYNVGDVDNDGYLFLYNQNITSYFVVDVNPNRSTYGYLVDPANSFQQQTAAPFGKTISTAINISDWSYNPQNGQLYAVNNATGNLLRINPVTGTVTTLTTTNPVIAAYGAAFFDNYNNFYGLNNTTGVISKFAISGNSAVRTNFATGQASGANDGARCAGAPIRFADIISVKTATPQVGLGETINYTVIMVNQGNTTAQDVIFIDTLPSGTVFNAGSLRINGVSNAGDPNPPSGVNIGNLGVGTHTITFTALATSLPTPNPTPNTASANFTFIDIGATPPATFTVGTNSNIAATTISFASILSTKTTNKGNVTQGDVIIYTVTLANSGNVSANNFIFIDTIPNGTMFVPSSLTQDNVAVSGTPSPPGVTLPRSIAPGAVSTVSFRVTVTSIPSVNPIPNFAFGNFSHVGNPQTSSTIRNNTTTSNVVTNPFVSPNLFGVTKAVDKAFASVGDILNYTITIPNTGNVTANNIVLVDTIPAGTTFVPNSVFVNGAQTSGDLRPPNSLLIASIPAGSITTITFQVTVNNSIPNVNPIPNRSTIGYNYVVDPSLGTSASVGGINTNIVTTTIISPIINPVKSVNQSAGYVGDPITYTIVLRNTGNATATNLLFVDTIPSGASFVANSLQVNGGSIPNLTPEPPTGITLPDIGINEVVTITFDALVDEIPTPNPLANIGTTSFNFIQNPLNSSIGSKVINTNLVTTFIYPITNPFKTVDKQFATVGDVLTYIIGWDERQNVTNTNVTLIDTLPNGLTFIPNSVAINGVLSPGSTVAPPNGLNVGTIAALQSVTVSYRAILNTIPSQNPIPNDYTVLFTSTLVSGLQSEVSNEVETQVNINVIQNVTKNVDKAFATVGDVLKYTITFNNIGNSTITRLYFVDTIPVGTSFVANSLAINGVNRLGATPNPPGVNQLGGTIPLGVSTVTFDVTVVSIPNSQNIPNIGTFSYDYLINPITGEVGKGVVNTSTAITTLSFANLSAPVKAVDKKFSNLPATLNYTVTIVNSGISTANGIIFRDTIPEGTSFVAGSLSINGIANSGSIETPGVTIPDISPGGITTINFTVLATTLPVNNPILNACTVHYSYEVNPITALTAPGSGNSNIVATQINQADLSGIIKSVDKSFATCGDILTYTIVIPNTGNVTSSNLILLDTVPNGTSFIANSLTVNGIATAGTPANINVGTIAPGAVSTVTFQVKVNCL